MRRRLIIGVATLVAIIALALPSHVVRRYALFVANGRGPVTSPYRLFLDPFPDAITCARQAAAINREGGHARCKSNLAFAVTAGFDNQIADDFTGVAGSWVALCTAAFSQPRAPAPRADERAQTTRRSS